MYPWEAIKKAEYMYGWNSWLCTLWINEQIGKCLAGTKWTYTQSIVIIPYILQPIQRAWLTISINHLQPWLIILTVYSLACFGLTGKRSRQLKHPNLRLPDINKTLIVFSPFNAWGCAHHSPLHARIKLHAWVPILFLLKMHPRSPHPACNE